MARSNAAEKQPAPENNESKVEQPDAGAQEAPESKAEQSPAGRVFELRLPGGGTLELRGAGKVEIAGLDQDVSIGKGENGPVALVAPEAEAPARERAADTMDRMLDLYDEAISSVAKAKGLEGTEKDAWLASMRDRKIEMIAHAMGEDNPEKNLVSALKEESGVAEQERQSLADLEGTHQEAKAAADAAYEAVAKKDNPANVAAYEKAMAEVYAVESQMADLHKQMDPEATAQEIAERVQGLVGVEISGKSLGDLEAEVGSLQEQMDAISGERNAERKAKISALEGQLRDIDAGKGGGQAEYTQIDAERQELMAAEDEPTVKWSVLEAARNKLAAVIPWMKDGMRMEEIKGRLGEIEGGETTPELKAEFDELKGELDELQKMREGMEAAGAAPREVAENFDPRETSVYRKFRAMYGSLNLTKRAESMKRLFGKMAESAPGSLEKKAFGALSEDIESGKVDYSALIETNEEGEATSIGGEAVEIPDLPDEALDNDFFDKSEYSNVEDLMESGDIESVEDLAGWNDSFNNLKAYAASSKKSMTAYGLPDTFQGVMALSSKQEEKPQGFFAKLFRRPKKYDLSPRAKAFEAIAQGMTESGASAGQFKELRQTQQERQKENDDRMRKTGTGSMT